MSSANAPASEMVPEQPRDDSDDGESEARVKMSPELEGLTETLTLKIFRQLDFPSLAAVKCVNRRLGRIAQDPSLLRRVSIVQWSPPKDAGWSQPKEAGSKGFLRTDCAELGSLPMPAEPEEAAAKFLEILGGLLEGGAALVSLETPLEEGEDGGVLASLPALLTKHSKRLRALSCCGESAGFLGLVTSQPEVAHLRLHGLSQAVVEELVKHAPNLRHLDILQYIQLGVAAESVEAMTVLMPQLRSLFIQQLHYNLAVLLEKLHAASGNKLLFRAINEVWSILIPLYPEEVLDLGLAVADFGREERGRLFLCEGKPGDAWDDARHTIPQPSTDIHYIDNFVFGNLRMLYNPGSKM